MIRIPRLNEFVMTITAAVAIVSAISGRADANASEYAWTASATGTTVKESPGSPVDLDVFSGESAQLGKFTGAGSHRLDPVDFTFVGEATWNVGKRSSLNVTYEGQLFPNPDPATNTEFPFAFITTLRVDGGTGRYRKAIGDAVMTGGFSGVPGKHFFDLEGTLYRDGYQTTGRVGFGNLQGALGLGEAAPYFAVGFSREIGVHLQTGSIQPTTPLVPGTEPGTFHFMGVQGANPSTGEDIHIIETGLGRIYCTWEAVFTIRFINEAGDAILSGDGAFTVVGGTGRYRGATGCFRTLFETGVVPAGADSALAEFTQRGGISRR